tara:strand:+ start:181 stop:483 length:303 start_codon:yes stop_codon:yes gene_type:complete
MKFFLSIFILLFLFSGCSKHAGIHNKSDSNLFTKSFETKTGGSISNHFLFGENSIKLINRADLRCKKINVNFEAKNLRRTYLGNIITDQMSIYEYDCKEN